MSKKAQAQTERAAQDARQQVAKKWTGIYWDADENGMYPYVRLQPGFLDLEATGYGHGLSVGGRRDSEAEAQEFAANVGAFMEAMLAGMRESLELPESWDVHGEHVGVGQLEVPYKDETAVDLVAGQAWIYDDRSKDDRILDVKRVLWRRGNFALLAFEGIDEPLLYDLANNKMLNEEYQFWVLTTDKEVVLRLSGGPFYWSSLNVPSS